MKRPIYDQRSFLKSKPHAYLVIIHIKNIHKLLASVLVKKKSVLRHSD